jgi:pimeloyl-ACP methyl ester carboxylesterase
LKKYIQQKLIPKSLGAYLGGLAYINPKASGKKALEIFGTPRKGKIRPKEEQFLQSFTKETLQYNDITIQGYKKGKGKLHIMFLHGWESNTARWRDAMNYLEKKLDITISAIDGPAHGNSGGQLFDSIQYANCIRVAYHYYKPDVLIGHSIGAGSIAYCMSELEHLPVSKIVLMGSPNSFDEILQSYVSIISLNRVGQSALHKAIEHKYNIKSSDYSVAKYAKQIACKTMVLHDAQDEIATVENAKDIFAALRNGELCITDGYRHSLQHKEVFEKLFNFLVK